jgi:hypothetical protein
MDETLKIFVKSELNIPIEDLCDLQGDLKFITPPNLDKLKARVSKGFRSPMFVWRDSGKWWLIDGHQRRLALVSLKADGMQIPDIPCCEILAGDIEEAKETILGITGQYGEFDTHELKSWLDLNPKIDSGTLRFVDTEIKLDLKFDFGQDNQEEEQDNTNKRTITVCPKCGHEWE